MTMTTEPTDLPDVAYAVAIAAFHDMTPARFRVLLDALPARVVFESIQAGDPALIERLAALGTRGAPAGPSAGRTGSQRADDDADMEERWGASGSVGGLERARARARDRLQAWRSEASSATAARRWEDLRRRDILAVRRGEAGYPARLLRARSVPELLYVRGRIDHAAAPCVGIVGTRRATHYGLEIAAELGRELAQRGVVVVSGLARGIDGAAHRGVLAAPNRRNGPLAVVGGGVDVVFPRENRRLWDEVIETGGLISEAPPGAAPEGWRFPLRNRIIAALSQVLVVVESSRQGGAIHTVLAANACGVPILAVPGSVRSPQSEGTNAIIQEGGAHLVLDVHDVLAALNLVCAADGTPRSFSGERPAGDTRIRINPRPQPQPPPTQQSVDIASVDIASVDIASVIGGAPSKRQRARRERDRAHLLAQCTPTERAVCEAVDYTPTMLDRVCIRTGLDLGEVALAIDRLEELGLVRPEGASWIRP